MQPRPYVDADLVVAQRAVATWVREAGRCGYPHPGDIEHRIYREPESQRDALVWEDEHGFAGIEITRRFGKVFDLFVRPDLRSSDAELEMLAVAATKSTETDVFTGDAARIELLQRIGFTRYRSWDHIRQRTLDDLPELRIPDGFSLSEDGTAARATIWLDQVNRVGLFEPVETHEGFRRLGLGRAVMAQGLRRMKEAGMHAAIVEHDITNEPAAALYASLGFTVAFETDGYVSLEAGEPGVAGML